MTDARGGRLDETNRATYTESYENSELLQTCHQNELPMGSAWGDRSSHGVAGSKRYSHYPIEYSVLNSPIIYRNTVNNSEYNVEVDHHKMFQSALFYEMKYLHRDLLIGFNLNHNCELIIYIKSNFKSEFDILKFRDNVIWDYTISQGYITDILNL